ncbi:MAG: hypothetical protein KDC43_01210 [Saprospiraceae bacterium]|nr:hypothetical protein [Saprospiraceae bacterium]MCB0622556.1 hypothetical protein [Saprospiraceae bacterium]MCB0677423.1 hypothetical protein [Saprospiraceae bacterium]MCB0680004.1 hypothetical protein [Saprospiraceae bacterium]
MNTVKLLCLLGLALSCSHCSDQPNYEKMAAEICKCSEGLVPLYSQVEELFRNNEGEKAMALMGEIESEMDAQADCIDRISEKYGEIETDEAREQIHANLVKLCPDVAELLDQGGVEHEE